MVDIMEFNQYIINELNKMSPIRNKVLLDLGASKYGYAMTQSLLMGTKEYVGIDLDIDEEIQVDNGVSKGRLLRMNAEKLKFNKGFFDLIISVSTFEHFLNPKKVLNEMFRVLKKGGCALVTFGPIWTSASGFHLHQYPEIARYIPKWSHLLLSRRQMANCLKKSNFPKNLDMSILEVINWIYKDKSINRYDIKKLRSYFEKSKFKIEWMIPLFDDDLGDKKAISKYLSMILPYTDNELMTRGLSILMSKT